jgi:hypothetical protein
VNDWNDLFLGTIAVATLLMALAQVGAMVVAARFARQAQQTLVTVHEEIRPLLAKATASTKPLPCCSAPSSPLPAREWRSSPPSGPGSPHSGASATCGAALHGRKRRTPFSSASPA